MRYLYSVLFVGVIGCASAPPAGPTAGEALPAPLTTFDTAPFWFGRSEVSPFGQMPYGLASRRVGDRLVLRGDVPDGLGMPPGAYQQFTFTPGETTALAFETSFTGDAVLGSMVEVARTTDKITFCLEPAAGGCDKMTVSFTRVPTGVLFETSRDGESHHRVLLVGQSGGS